MENRVSKLFKIEHPIIQGGMIWCSGWRLASAVSNCGGLGLLGAGSMHPELLREHIQKCKKATKNPFGVNVPLLYPQIEEIMKIIIQEGVEIVFTSAGNPKTWTKTLQDSNITVAHVVSSSLFAKKAEDAGVNAIVAEGFEAGGHNGREETTTFCLIPSVREETTLPLIAAGGVYSKGSIEAAYALGAEGVQIGTRFALSVESSAHDSFKNRCRGLNEGETKLYLKKIAPVRLAENGFSKIVKEAEESGVTLEMLIEILGKGRAKRAIFEGDLEEGEIEIGQISHLVKKEESVGDIFRELV